MSENERIIANANATMEMEGMPLTEEDKKLGMDCLEGKISFQDAIENLVRQYTQPQAGRV